jgi:Concanavalin A-like lectin/glucanases superfamily
MGWGRNEKNSESVRGICLYHVGFCSVFCLFFTNCHRGTGGYWKFDEGIGDSVLDSRGSGNHGWMVNTTYTDDTPGQIVSMFALGFNSTLSGYAYSYATIADSPSLRPNSSLTLAAWVKTDTNDTRSCGIITKQYGSSYHNSFALWYQYGTLRFCFEDGMTVPTISTAPSPTNEWHHIVVTYDGSIMRLYVDGIERVNKTAAGSILYDSNPVLIGADCDNADHHPDAGWDGYIDDVLIYNRALNQTEISQLIVPEFPSVLMLPLFMSATMIGVIAYAWRRRKQANPSFSFCLFVRQSHLQD